MLRVFEQILRPTALPPDAPPPTIDTPRALPRFYWHFLRQAPRPFLAVFVCGLAVALLDSSIPVFIGHVVALVSRERPETLFRDAGRTLLLMMLVLLVVRPAALFGQYVATNQVVTPGMTNLVRWQNHFHVVRQSWTFFQNDFAGRIANRVIQTGPALRESVVQGAGAVWYLLVYGGSAIAVLAHADPILAIPVLLWFVAYACMLRYFVPRMRERSRAMSEMRSTLTGRIVDSYTNIVTVKLFARARDEDAFVRDSIDEHTASFHRQLRMTTGWTMTLSAINACMVVGTAGLAILGWRSGHLSIAAVGTALPLAWQINGMSGWVAMNITSIFENVGVVQDGMRSIAVARGMPDRPGSTDLHLTAGAIRFENLSFDYGRPRAEGERGGVLRGLDLDIRPGERVGLIGRSGAGKSTLVNLLLRFHDPDGGRITIDGIDIAGVTQESLRAEIGMVTQDTSLLHRSIRDNLRYGRPDATDAEIRAAAERAHAIDFIDRLVDWEGRQGFDAHVGERGVKLSGGQRQRIAIARVILKDAPILVLDEATSALDSEVEAAIQEQLDALMEGRTVIAIAHRLSTIAQMDKLAVLDGGRIAELGSHAELLALGGRYASLWARQSGGFLPETAAV